jgi:hypothetical protein
MDELQSDAQEGYQYQHEGNVGVGQKAKEACRVGGNRRSWTGCHRLELTPEEASAGNYRDTQNRGSTHGPPIIPPDLHEESALNSGPG